MGERCDIMNEIADWAMKEDEHRRWADETGYRRDCSTCATVAALQKQRKALEKENQELRNGLNFSVHLLKRSMGLK